MEKLKLKVTAFRLSDDETVLEPQVPTRAGEFLQEVNCADRALVCS
jgi:hypothetical protein